MRCWLPNPGCEAECGVLASDVEVILDRYRKAVQRPQELPSGCKVGIKRLSSLDGLRKQSL